MTGKTGKVEETISLLITKAEVGDICFRSRYTGGYYLQVEVALFAGVNKLTTMYLSSLSNICDPDYIEFDDGMQKALESVLSKIKTNANLSLQKVGRHLETTDEVKEDVDSST